MFDKVLVANRTEIAVRVMQACKELGIETVAVYSEPDSDAKHVRYADEAYNIGPAEAAQSYLNQDQILDVAREADVNAIHPGYGFLAENATFAEQVEASEFVWIGPPSKVMRKLGEKTSARNLMQSAEVPIVPGTTDPITDADQVRQFAAEHGYPVAIKAVGGGGGRGLKVVDNDEDVEAKLENAIREGDAYFDNPEVYVEKFLENPKHVEIQILSDTHGNIRHLGERDCSIQRRQQKLVEETPSPIIDDTMRERMGEAARRGAREAGYVNAGTVEFLVEDEQFYFLEVNTRIQVEHTITEVATDIDIVKWQLRIAAGESLTFPQSAVSLDRAAIEFRINAEDATNSFMPSPGILDAYRPPKGIGVRVDDGFEQGDDINPHYDSMIGKYIVSGKDRSEALARARRTLDEAVIKGVETTIPFHSALLDEEAFLSGKYSTKFVEHEMNLEEI